MRALLGLLVLGGLFVMAASWQNRMTSELRDSRALRYGIPNDSVEGPDGWSRLVLGRPSGADALPLPEDLDDAVDSATATPRGDGSTLWEEGGAPGPGAGTGPGARPGGLGANGSAPPTVPQPFAYIVRPNDSLGEICQKHYDVRPLQTVVDAVAQYNGLSSANAIRAGATLDLPDETVLFPELGD